MAEPGGLPSLGSHRVEHDQSDLAAAAAGSLELERDEGQKTFMLSLPAYFIFREGNRSSHTSQLINIPYTLWFSHVLQTFSYSILIHSPTYLTVEKFWCSHAYQSFLQQSKFIIFTHLASYTITFVGKCVCSLLIWSDISSYANICVYLHLFSISFIDVTLLFEWCQYSHLIILCQYFLNYSQTFFQPDEFHTTTSRELFHLEVTTVLSLKKNLTIAYISCGLLLKKYVPLNSRITAVKEDIHALTGL